jgi:hypothetical protein
MHRERSPVKEERTDTMTNQNLPCISIPMEDELVHTDEQMECDDRTCPCHENMTDGTLLIEMTAFSCSADGTPLVETSR